MTKINCILMQSLERISLIKTGIALWNHDDIRTLMGRSNFISIYPENEKKWQEIEDTVTENVEKLFLPEALKKKLLDIIKPVGFQILEWLQYHVCDLGIILPSNLCWTSHGTIDSKRTVEILINDECLDVTTRYKLACFYCLENDIPLLWDKISENCKKTLICEKKMDIVPRHLELFWTYCVEEKFAKLNKCPWRNNAKFLYGFDIAVRNGNKAAAEYFLPKLTPQEREVYLVMGAVYLAAISSCSSSPHKIPHSHTMCYLLSEMSEDEQNILFQLFPDGVLYCLLAWPWQDVCLETSEILKNFISRADFHKLLCNIIDKIAMGYKDYNYHKLLRMFWLESPLTHKRYVIDTCGPVLMKLFKINDRETIKLILKYATIIERKKIIFAMSGKDICKGLIQQDKWDLLQFFVEECITSKELMIKFKGGIEKLVTSPSPKRVKEAWSKFLKLLEGLIQEQDKKRSIEDGDSCASKRLCM